MDSRVYQNHTQADFVTSTHRISGSVQTGSKPLLEVLNDTARDYLAVQRVYASPLNNPGAISTYAPLGFLSKEALGFVIVSAREARIPNGQRFGVQPYTIAATVPGFELQGRFLGPRRLDLSSFSPALLDPFVALQDASAISIAVPEVTFDGEVILVNRARLESLLIID